MFHVFLVNRNEEPMQVSMDNVNKVTSLLLIFFQHYTKRNCNDDSAKNTHKNKRNQKKRDKTRDKTKQNKTNGKFYILKKIK